MQGSILFALALAAASPTAPQEAAGWVSLIDNGAYDQSWSRAGSLFKARIGEADWSKTIEPTRKPLGAILSRTLDGEQAAKSLPGAPDGDYDIVRFNTEFANKHAAVETVVLRREADGWKVNGYFIK
jgi:hypothetical protein